MSYQDPLNPMPPRPSEVEPLQQPATNPARHQNFDGPWKTGTIASAVIAVLVVVGLIVWAASTNQQTTSNPPAQTTGQGTR